MTDTPNPNIRMFRPNLDDIADAALPAGFRLVNYRPGDDASWTEIHRLTYVGDSIKITPDLHSRMFGTDDNVLSRRQLFIESPTGEKIATATAWFRNDPGGESVGQVHWVAIVPAYQGRGLAKPLLRAVLLRMKELGHDKAMLITQPTRVAAIQLYLKFGFTRELRAAEPAALVMYATPPIALAGSATEAACFARDELERYLGLILNAAGPEDAGRAPESPVCRRIELRVAPGQFDSDEAYRWRADGETVEIVAGGDLGLVFGVYAFLRDVCGCVFAAPGPAGELIPRCSPLRLKVFPVRRAPVLWYRGIQCYFFEPPEHYQQQIDWLTKNGYNFVEYHLADPEDAKVLREQVDPKTGQPLFPAARGPSAFDESYFEKHLLPVIRRRGLKLDFNHHNLWFWVPPHRHQSTHPEWFSLVDGKRGANLNQLCLCTSNPEVVEELVRRVKEFLKTHPDVRIVGVVPEDGIGMCQCEACLAGDVDRRDAFAPPRDHRTAEGENRSLINRYARLLNTVARAIREEFPGVLVGGSAYVNMTLPPRDIPLEPNLVIQVAVYWRDGARPLAPHGTSRLNAFFYDVIRRWRSALPGRVLLYEYYMGMMAQKCLPYPMADVIEADWQSLRAGGIDGASIQCCAGATHSYALNLAAFGRCAWGEPVAAPKLAADYARALYGAAAEALGWIFERWHQTMAELRPLDPSLHAAVGVDPSWSFEPILKPDGTSIVHFWRSLGGDALVSEALAAARTRADSPRTRQNVDELATYLEYCRLAAAAMDLSRRAEAIRAGDPRAAVGLLREAVDRRLPALIDYLHAHPMPGWVLPRMRSSWENERKTRARELARLDATHSLQEGQPL